MTQREHTPLTWIDVFFVAQLAAFMAIRPEAGNFFVRFLMGALFGGLAVGFWRGWEWVKARIVNAWARRQARKRAIDEATP